MSCIHLHGLADDVLPALGADHLLLLLLQVQGLLSPHSQPSPVHHLHSLPNRENDDPINCLITVSLGKVRILEYDILPGTEKGNIVIIIILNLLNCSRLDLT